LLKRSLEGYSAEEIARSAGITSTGIRVRLLRIRQSLRDRMAMAAA
jgi:DNA-directed RNA polymerase specialized sigma24 family protein